MIENKSTKIFSIIMGMLTGIFAIPHGISEIAQGNISSTDILPRIGVLL